MLSRKSVAWMAAGGLVAIACTSFHNSANRGLASVATWDQSAAKEVSSSQIASFSSSGNMRLANAKLITDNNRAFQSKLDIVRNAKHELRMVYYIYNEDFSSSVFNTEVIAAAGRGVKVSLLVDFITNYERLDLFNYLESVGKGNIQVHFYGVPTEAILRGAVYQTLPCSQEAVKSPEQCQTEKMALLQQLGNPLATWFSKMYLTGLYGKNADLLKAAIGIGAQFDPKNYQKGPVSPEQKAQLKKFIGLFIKAKVQNDLKAKMKLAVALHTNAELLNPIMNELTGRLPIAEGNLEDWNHITDYTHHKLIVADGEKFQLGGRNIEDSYHTDSIQNQIHDSKGKYTFMDTDFYAETRDAKQIEAAYDKLFLYSPMVGSLLKIQAFAPNEYDMNTNAFKMSLGACMKEGKLAPADLEACVGSKITSMPGYRNMSTRMQTVRDNMDLKSRRFVSDYKIKSDFSWKAGGDAIEAGDISHSEAFYVENLTFDKNKPSQRLFGSKIGEAPRYGKNLHAAWLKGLENVCAASAKTKTLKRVILHSAYLYLPADLTNALGNMINGKWNCHYVDVTIITNSFQTTDLNIINIFARYQMQALLAYNQSIERNPGAVTANQYKARIRYFEYAPGKPGSGISLHSKVSVLGDDMIIGSANADVRSYFMDTNNGIYVRNMPGMISNYTAFVDRILADRNRVTEFTSFYANVTNEHLMAENQAILRSLLEKYDQKGKLSKERQDKILAYLNDVGGKVRSTTQEIISAPASLDSVRNSGNPGDLNEKMIQLEKLSNNFNEIWKVL
jgi:phosphatidylserine/phosphatidylglycerophosphate/cardiolipin synthase-like enzyme